MCLDRVSVGYDGKDCDFNQQPGYDINNMSVFDMESLMDLQAYNIRTDNHTALRLVKKLHRHTEHRHRF